MPYSIEKIIREKKKQIEEWFDEKWQSLNPNIYLSCDIRHSGFKIAIVDTNLFPSGFNNLCNAYSRQTSQAFKGFLDTFHPDKKNILIYAEEHTRNKFYLKNLKSLESHLIKTGRNIYLGVLGEYLSTSKLEIPLEKESVVLNKIELKGNQLACGSFKPDLILSNNDFSSGLPEIFRNISIPIIPSSKLGWHQRRKNKHFNILNRLLNDFANRFEIDSWTFSTDTDTVKNIDLADKPSLYPLAQKVEVMLDKIKKKYDEHSVTETPYVYLKSTTGTYGLGLLPIFSGEEVLNLNRRKRGKLTSSKGGMKTDEYLVQEGIPTADFYSGFPIEPVIYVVGKEPVGGFFRIHESKNELESLNAPGMTFSCLCLHKLEEPHEKYFIDCKQKEDVVLMSGLLARMAALAAAKETPTNDD